MVDYIVIGGGSAGCVLAGRLSQDRAVRVCLLIVRGVREWRRQRSGLLTTNFAEACGFIKSQFYCAGLVERWLSRWRMGVRWG